VIPLGLEPRTLSLKVRCSNQLSYEIMSSKNFQLRQNTCALFGGAKIDGIFFGQIRWAFFFFRVRWFDEIETGVQPLSPKLGLSFAR
jgi:hypothetical protein